MTTQELKELGADLIWLGLDNETVATLIGLAVFGNEVLRTLPPEQRAAVAKSVAGREAAAV